MKHVRVRGMEHRGLLLTIATGHWRLLTTLVLDMGELRRMRRGRGPGGHSDDGGSGRDGGRHQHLTRATHRIKVGEWT